MLRPNEAQGVRQRSVSVGFAETKEDVLEAQRLRYRIFGEEMGAALVSAHEGIDRDKYDPYCRHLLARDDDTGEVVGTYRILSPEGAKQLGGYYSDTEFDLSRIDNLRPVMAEVGRSCVHPDYRTGSAIALMWSTLARYASQQGYQYLIGCASISMADGGHVAADVYERIKDKYLTPQEWRVFPRTRLPLEALKRDIMAMTPPLIKGYLRLGAYVGGEPAWDPDFNTADLFILMPIDRFNERYARHFFKR